MDKLRYTTSRIMVIEKIDIRRKKNQPTKTKITLIFRTFGSYKIFG